MNLIWYQSLRRTRHFSYYRYILGSKKNWANLLLPVLHQKWRIYHLISQVRKLLIKLAWSNMLGMKEIQKVHIIDLTLYVLLCYRLSALLIAFATSIPFFSLHSLQHLSPPHFIQNNSFSTASISLQLSPVEAWHGGTAPHQESLQTHRRNRGSASFESWQRKVLE